MDGSKDLLNDLDERGFIFSR